MGLDFLHTGYTQRCEPRASFRGKLNPLAQARTLSRDCNDEPGDGESSKRDQLQWVNSKRDAKFLYSDDPDSLSPLPCSRNDECPREATEADFDSKRASSSDISHLLVLILRTGVLRAHPCLHNWTAEHRIFR